MNSLFKPQFLPECIDRIECEGLQTEAGLDEVDNYVYTEAEEKKMMQANIVLGIIWWMLSYFPILMWYLWRRPNIRKMKLDGVNLSYYFAWNFMWKAHYFVF